MFSRLLENKTGMLKCGGYILVFLFSSFQESSKDFQKQSAALNSYPVIFINKATLIFLL